ncbi:hypothetical protein EJB05_01930, partial [Eragrostis curvula]
MVCMAGVGPEWSHSMAHALALDARTWPRGDVPGLGLTDEDVGLLRGSSQKNSEVNRAWPGAISGWVTAREVLPGCARVCGPGLEETGRYKWYQSQPSWFHGRVRAQLPRHGAYGWCGLRVVTQRGTCAGTGRTDVTKRGGSWIGVDRRGRRSSKGVSM